MKHKTTSFRLGYQDGYKRGVATAGSRVESAHAERDYALWLAGFYGQLLQRAVDQLHAALASKEKNDA